jgi:hypothetical protein
MSLLDGLKKSSPPPVDSSMTPPKGSVNDSPTRSSPGKVGAAPGPRTA